MASPIVVPRDDDNVPTGFAIANLAGVATPVWLRALGAAVVDDEQATSGALAVGGMELHDAAETTAIGPVKMGGIASAAAPTSVNADGDVVRAWLLRNGAQATVITAAGALIGGDAANGLDVDVTRVTGTVTIAGAVTNAGTFAVQVDGAALTSLQLIDDVIFTDDNGFTPATSKVAMVGFEADESSTDSVDEGDAGAARMTLDRKLITTPQPHTAGGLSTFNASGADGADNAALTSTAVAVKGSAGQLYGWSLYNPNDEASFINFYDIAQGSVTVGSSNVKLQISLPAGAGANVMGAHGIPFGTAITVSATKTAGSNTAPDTAMDVQLFYK